ncbi:ATP:ADP antiporter, AAA family, partial [Pancytospora epiphaga]
FMSLFFAFGLIILFEEHIMFSPSTIQNQFSLYKFDARGLGFLKYFLLTINQPLATLIYITAELWGSLMLSYLFLSFLNETCTRRQHGRFLPPLFIVANVSLLLSAITTTFFFKIRAKLSFEENILFMAGIFFIEGGLTLLLLLCKYYLETGIMKRPIFKDIVRVESNSLGTRRNSASKAKTSIGFLEGLEIMMKSRFLLAMSCIVFFYSALTNMLETVYKNSIKKGAKYLGREKGAYSGWYNNLDQYITAITVIVLNMSSFSNLTQT